MQRINFSLSKTGLLMAALLVCIQVVAETFNLELNYAHLALERGVLWPAITGHFVHLSVAHLILNTVATYLVIDAFESGFYRWRLPVATLLLAAMISAGLFSFYPSLRYYAGFSGVLHGMVLLGAIWCPRYSDWIRWTIVAVVVAKVGWEQSPYYDERQIARFIGAPVAEQAHLLGIAGAAIILLGARFASAFRH